MELFILIIMILDGMLIGSLVFALIELLFGDGPLARLMKLLLGVGSGIAYFILCAHLAYGDILNINGSLVMFVIFAPVGFMGIVRLKDYMFKKK